jgi:hypothetical protein
MGGGAQSALRTEPRPGRSACERACRPPPRLWACLPATAAAAYSHTVRTAANDAVRVLLAHGANSPDAATAVEHLVARLEEQHGRLLVQDVADELVVELAEATAAVAIEDEHDGHPVNSA